MPGCKGPEAGLAFGFLASESTAATDVASVCVLWPCLACPRPGGHMHRRSFPDLLFLPEPCIAQTIMAMLLNRLTHA